jgi:hypothetical protein
MKALHVRFLLLVSVILVCSASYAQPPGEWTWMKGSNVTGAAGTFGVQGVPNPANTPPSLYESMEWTDLQGNFWLFGGSHTSGGLYADLWKYDPVNNVWTWVKGPGINNPPGVYGVQGVPSPLNYPKPRAAGGTWVDANGDLWLCGGGNYFANPLNDLWRYNISTNEWTWMKGSNAANQPGTYGTMGVPAPANTPGARTELGTTWSDNNNLWIFGGYGYNNVGIGNLSDMWKYDVLTNQWTWMNGSMTLNVVPSHGTLGVPSPTNTPGGRYAYTKWKDQSSNFWFFAGTGTGGNYNDMWKFDKVTLQWTWMSGPNLTNQPAIYGTRCVAATTNRPINKFEARTSWTDACGNFWSYGGTDNGGFTNTYNDLWTYNPLTSEWTFVFGSMANNTPPVYGAITVSAPTNNPGGRCAPNAWYQSSTGNLFLFGGGVANFPTCRNDMWRYVVDPNCGGCQSVVPVAIVMSNDTAVCDGDCANVSVTASSGTPPYTYAWNPNIGSGAGPFQVCPNATTTYIVTVTDAAGSSATDSVTVTVNALPAATITPGGTVSICTGSSITLNANTGSNLSYQWYENTILLPGATDSTYTTSSAADYQVMVTDNATGCSAMSPVTTVDTVPGPVVTVTATGGSCGAGVILIGYSGAPIVLTANATGAVSYSWSTGDTTQSITVTQAGSYSVLAYSSNGCPSSVPGVFTVTAINVACGHNGDKVILCHVPPGNPNNPQTICVAASAIPHHLANHPDDCIGPCSLYYPRTAPSDAPITDADFEHAFFIDAYPNPFSGTFSLQIHSSMDSPIDLKIYDMVGKMVESYYSVSERTIFGSNLTPGAYFIEAHQEGNLKRLHIIKQ